MQILLVLYIASGVLLSALAMPLILRRVPPNALYGFRVQQTLDSPVLWYRVNAYAGRRLLAAGLCTVVAGLALFPVPQISVDAYTLGRTAVSAVVLITGFVQSFRYMRQIEANRGNNNTQT